MSASRRITEIAKGLGDSGGPVTGRARRCERAPAARHGDTAHAAGLDSRREAVLRVLLEAYRRDLGPGALDSH